MLVHDIMRQNRILCVERDNLYGDPTSPILRFWCITLPIDHRLYTVCQEPLLNAWVKLRIKRHKETAHLPKLRPIYIWTICHSSSRHDVHSADHFVSDRVEQKAVACIVCESNKDRIHVWRIQLHSHLARQLCLIRKITPTATNTSIHRRYSLLRSSRHIFLTSSQLVFVSFHVSKSYILSFKSLHLITSRRYFLVLQNFF